MFDWTMSPGNQGPFRKGIRLTLTMATGEKVSRNVRSQMTADQIHVLASDVAVCKASCGPSTPFVSFVRNKRRFAKKNAMMRTTSRRVWSERSAQPAEVMRPVRHVSPEYRSSAVGRSFLVPVLEPKDEGPHESGEGCRQGWPLEPWIGWVGMVECSLNVAMILGSGMTMEESGLGYMHK